MKNKTKTEIAGEMKFIEYPLASFDDNSIEFHPHVILSTIDNFLKGGC